MLLLLLLSCFSCVRLCVTPETAAHQALPSPCNSPGKNTGVSCHFLLQCMKVKSESEVTQSCLTVSDPMDGSPPGSSVREIFQARVLEWGAIAFSEIQSVLCAKCCAKQFNLLYYLNLTSRPMSKFKQKFSEQRRLISPVRLHTTL